MAESHDIPASHLLVIMPSWLGDGVMATPLLRALRLRYPHSQITALASPLVMPVLTGLPFVDETREYHKQAPAEIRPWLRQKHFDLAVLLPNSFRSAWITWRAGIPRRLGYAREARGWLLTDRLRSALRTAEQQAQDRQKEAAIRAAGGGRVRVGSSFEPLPTIDYYLALAAYLGAPAGDRRMALGITEDEKAQAEQALASQGIAPDEPLVVMVPGANFGSSKCWLPERFAQVADRLMDRQGDFRATVLLASSPAERPIAEAILKASCLAARGRLIALSRLNDGRGLSLGSLKSLVRRARLMICNDTGPRHFAAALNVPVVTLFGPTDPRWAETFFEKERQVRMDVACSPCQLKRCPIDHRCMTAMTVERVLEAAAALWPPPIFPDVRSSMSGVQETP